MTYAVIYTRVSSQKQVEEGHGCESQESACRHYCKSHGLTVLKVFHEQAISGASLYRPAFDDLCGYLKQQSRPVKVVMDDVSRLARDHILYSHLKTQITQSGGEICFVNMQFEDSPEGQYVETIIAATAELERKQNARRTKSRMRARAKAGFYLSRAPLGYKYVKDSKHGKILIPKNPDADYIKQALEGYASGRFETQFEVRDFINENLGTDLVYNSVRGLLTRKFYAGIIDIPSLGVHSVGKHQPLIDLQTFEKIQTRLQSRQRMPRTAKRLLFPLKTNVRCEACGKRLTGSVSKGRNKRYAYYHCANKYCDERGKTIPKDRFEKEFVDLLKQSQVKPFVIDMALEMLGELKENRQAEQEERLQRQTKDLKATEQKIETYLDKMLETDDRELQARIEKRIKSLQLEKLKLENKPENIHDLTESFRTAMTRCRNLFESPDMLWVEGDENIRKTLPKMVFDEDLTYCRKTGFPTASKSLPFRVIDTLETGNFNMVELDEILSNTTKMLGWFSKALGMMDNGEELGGYLEGLKKEENR